MLVNIPIPKPKVVTGELNCFVIRRYPGAGYTDPEREEVVAGFMWKNQAIEYCKARNIPGRYSVVTQAGLTLYP